MKTLKLVAALLSVLFYLLCFASMTLGFNPQPEPPAKTKLNQKTMEPLDKPAPSSMQQHLAPGAEKMEEEEEPVQTREGMAPQLPTRTKAIDPVDDGKKLLPSAETLKR